MKESKNNEVVKDILIICSDGLKGINETIKTVYPNWDMIYNELNILYL